MNSLLTFYTCISFTQAARILGIFSMAGRSHYTFSNAILKTLASVGHEITVITPFPKESAEENFTSVVDISEGLFIDVSQTSVEQYTEISTYKTFQILTEIERRCCEKIINLKIIQDLMEQNTNEKSFHIMLVELLHIHRCYLWIAQKFNIPVIGVIPQRSWPIGEWDIGNPRHPILKPFEFARTASPKNFYDRLYNTFLISRIIYYRQTMMKNVHTKFYEKNVKNELSFEEFMNNKPSLIFVNSHPSYFPHSINSNMIQIGGIHIQEDRALPKDIQQFLDGAKRGAILFTFGSKIRAAKEPRDKIQAFKEAFAEIPQRVIWKYEEEMEEVPSNVILSKWLPQKDILAHKNIKAFITHCGQGAIHESIYHAVPLISCPLFSDQFLNANIFENLEIAVNLDYETLTKESILKAINEVINNTKYYEKMQQQSCYFRDRPMTPQETVIYWTEYVIRHNGAPHLMSAAVDLNWFQYLLLDVICFAFLILLVTIYVAFRVSKFCCQFAVSRFDKKLENKHS